MKPLPSRLILLRLRLGNPAYVARADQKAWSVIWKTVPCDACFDPMRTLDVLGCYDLTQTLAQIRRLELPSLGRAHVRVSA